MNCTSATPPAPVPVRNWVTVDGATVHQHQLVVRRAPDGGGDVELWVVTELSTENPDSDACVIELADLNFNFRVTVSCESFHVDGFESVTATDGTPVWGY